MIRTNKTDIIMNRISRILLAGVMVALAGSHQARGDDGAVTGQYWFDNSTTTTSFTPGHLEIPVTSLSDGFHTFNAYVEKDGVLSSVCTSGFFKIPVSQTAEEYTVNIQIDDKPFGLYQKVMSDDGMIMLSLDVNSLPLGLHTINVHVVSPGGTGSEIKESVFLRVPTTQQVATMQAFYVLDDTYYGKAVTNGDGSLFHLDIDASILTSGIHTVSVYLVSPLGFATTAIETALFIKTPEGGEGVKRYEYWINENYADCRQVTLDAVANPLQIISLLDIPEAPFRSASYSFAVEDGIPVIYPLNEFNIRFYDPDNRVTLGSRTFADVRGRSVLNDIEALENTVNINQNLPLSIADNQIKWYSFKGEIGDSVAMHLSKGGMIELFDPEGDKILAKSGADAIGLSSYTLTMNGTYYIAVHDLASTIQKPVLNFSHTAKYAIVRNSPTKSANCSDLLIVDVLGNGFNNLSEIRIENGQNILKPDVIQVIDNYNLKLQFNKIDLPVGNYSIAADFTDSYLGESKTILKENAITFDERNIGKIDVTVETSNIREIPYPVDIKIKNTGNVPAVGVPFNIAQRMNGYDFFVNFENFGVFVYNSDGSKTELYDDLVIYTENLVGTGKKGVYIPMIIPYIGPNETITLSVGFTINQIIPFPFYAWAGKPWNIEFEEILSHDYDLDKIINFSGSNMFSAAYLCYINALLKEMEEDSEPMQVYKAGGPKRSNWRTLQNVSNLASNNANVAQAVGQTIGSIGLASDARVCDAYLKAYGESDATQEIAEMRNGKVARMYNPRAIIAQAFGCADEYAALEKFARDNANCADPEPKEKNIVRPRSSDPNDMYGYTSPSGDNYIGIGVNEVAYTIEFENDPEIANASAARIKVDNSLDGKVFDLTTFKPLKMIIGKKETELPASHSFVHTLDMRPEINAIAELSFNYDADKGEASWSIRSLDPMTLEPTRYIDDGILPVNDETGRGTGFLTYSIGLLDGLADGTKIKNSAVIVFDDNEPISTPEYVNVTDYTLPEARIAAKQSEDNLTFTFSVDGSDSGSGVWYYNLYVRPSGSKTWTLVRHMIEEDEFSYTASSVLEGADFAVVAVDRAGNSQKAGFLTALTGDADDNGVINASDVVITVNYYMDSSVKLNRDNADVNLDGVINAQDATIISNLYLGDGPFKARSRKYPKKK